MKTTHSIDHLVKEKLYEVIDPEMYISIMDLGLVYETRFDKGHAHITMTLTSLGCPLFSIIENDIKSKLLSLPGIDTVTVNLTFEPPWSVERMSERGKATLGI